MFYSRCLFWAVFLVWFGFERRSDAYFGRLNASILHHSCIKDDKGASLILSHLIHGATDSFTSRSRVGISAGWLLDMEDLFWDWIGLYGLDIGHGR